MSLLLTIFGSGLTIFGGTLIYAWQRSFDRTEELHRELREVYKNYFVSLVRQISVYGMSPINYEDSSRSHSVYVETLALIAPIDVVAAIDLVESAKLDLQISFDPKTLKSDPELRDKVRQLRSDALNKMREDLFTKTDAFSKFKSAVAVRRKK